VKRLSGETLFLVGSPFQCLCMFEAVDYFELDKFDVIVTYSDTYSLSNIDILLKKNKVSYKKLKNSHIIFDIIPIFFSLRKNYENIFIGDFNSDNDISIAYIYAKFRAKIYFLDDGLQILSYFSTYKKNDQKIILKFIFNCYKLIAILKRINTPIFFTIFAVTSRKFNVIRNPLKRLTNVIKSKPIGIYIIGTNSSVLEFKENNYTNFLVSLFKMLQNRFPYDDIFYCPHRRDSNFDQIISLCKSFQIQIFQPKVAVEIDFIENNINPKYLVGFSSNALFTLRLVYPETTIETVLFKLQSEVLDNENKLVVEHLRKNNILPIHLS
jgi:hypothetical protein